MALTVMPVGPIRSDALLMPSTAALDAHSGVAGGMAEQPGPTTSK